MTPKQSGDRSERAMTVASSPSFAREPSGPAIRWAVSRIAASRVAHGAFTCYRPMARIPLTDREGADHGFAGPLCRRRDHANVVTTTASAPRPGAPGTWQHGRMRAGDAPGQPGPGRQVAAVTGAWLPGAAAAPAGPEFLINLGSSHP